LLLFNEFFNLKHPTTVTSSAVNPAGTNLHSHAPAWERLKTNLLSLAKYRTSCA